MKRPKVPDVKVFHSGTALGEAGTITNGDVCWESLPWATPFPAAKLQAYTAIKCIRWKGLGAAKTSPIKRSEPRSKSLESSFFQL